MAQPDITQLHQVGTSPYWQGHTSSLSGDFDSGVVNNSTTGNVRVYAIDGDSTDPTYSYAELMAEINSSSDWTVTTATSSSEGAPTRTFTIQYNVPNTMGIIYFRTGTLYHEIGGTTAVVMNTNVYIPLIGAPVTIDRVGNNESEVSSTTGDSTWTASHNIEVGRVVWRFPTSTFAAVGSNVNGSSTGNGPIRPVDWGSPFKSAAGANASPFQASLAMINPASGQTLTVTDSRLVLLFNLSSQRRDCDVTGEGRLNVEFEAILEGTGAGFVHNTNTNTGSIIKCWTYVNVPGFNSSGNAISTKKKIDGNFEIFSLNPPLVYHPYVDRPTRTNSAVEIFVRNTVASNASGGLAAQALAAFAGTDRFSPQPASLREDMVLQGIKAENVDYMNAVASATVDMVMVDPAFSTATDTVVPPWDREKTQSGSRNPKLYFMRSIGVNNNDAAGNPKSSEAFVLGNQSCDTADFLAFISGSWMNEKFPAPRTFANGGTWSSRSVDRNGAGVENRVGRGVHYLHDVQLAGGTRGNLLNQWDFCSSANESGNAGQNLTYLIHRGGVDRPSANVVLRGSGAAQWSGTSLGGGGIVVDNDVDDTPGVDDWGVGFFEAGHNFTVDGAVSSGSTEIVVEHTDLTTTNAYHLIGCNLVLSGIPSTARVSSVSSTADGSATITLSTATTAAIADNATIAIRNHADYTWDMNTSATDTTRGVFTLSIGSNVDKTMTYTQLACLLQAKLEFIATEKREHMGTENASFTSTDDPTYTGTGKTINDFVSSICRGTTNLDYQSKGTATGTVNIGRFALSIGTGGSLTLNPDNDANNLNLGSYNVGTFVANDTLIINGAYQDSNGAASFLELTLPSGVTASDLTCSVGGVVPVSGTDTWQVFRNPTVTTDSGRTFVRISAADSTGVSNLVNSTWYVSVTGPKTYDLYLTNTSSLNETVALTADPFYKAAPTDSSLAKSGDIRLRPYDITNPGSSSENASLVTFAGNESYPRDYIDDVTHIYLDFIAASNVGYDDKSSVDRITFDVSSLKTQQLYADMVMRYGANLGTTTSILRSQDIDLPSETDSTDHYPGWRISITNTSRAQYLLIDSNVPTTSGTNGYKVKTVSGEQGFFGIPNFSVPATVAAMDISTQALVAQVQTSQTAVQTTIGTQTSTLQANISDAALGIP